GDCQRPARAPFTRDRNDDRNWQPGHLPQIACDRFALAALFRVNAGIRALRIDKREDGAAELRRELHHPQRLAIAFRLRLPEIPNKPLLGIAALLVANDGHWSSAILRQARNDGLVVRVPTVAV